MPRCTIAHKDNVVVRICRRQMFQEDVHTEQIILIYCRSGNRSKQAARKLADMGYTHIYEFGGINTWTGEIVK